jgi:NAD(P)-dependent dehydrogenase (short-subunit alcohol dehydrogenase family)
MTQPVAIIVGAGPGISLAVARRFGREGWQIALVARRQEALDAYVAELAQQGITALGFTADSSDFDGLKQTLQLIKQQIGAPTVLVYNVMARVAGTPTTQQVEEVMTAMRANLGGAIVATQAVVDHMAEGSSLLFTGGGLALNPHPNYAGLAVGKAALRNWVYSLAAELKPKGIHAATVTVAGFVKPETPFDPDRIADVFWTLHQQAPDAWQTEVVFDGQ